mgnify:CR=1 FL=1
MKHNKKRNTAFIYEVLVKELTKSIVSKDVARKNKVAAIIKEFFSKAGPLGLELELYGTLLETKNVQQNIAEKLLKETKSSYLQLNENIIFESQSRLISAINKNLGQEVWTNFVSNFKTLASVNAIFNSQTSVKKRVLFEQAVVDEMSSKKDSPITNKMKSLDNLAYNSFIKKFNGKYGFLLQEQKELLNHFITSFADNGFELSLYLNEELSRLKALLNATSQKELEPVIIGKVAQVAEYLEGFRRRPFVDADLKKILKVQELVQEIQ